jgi:hypothetical protein
MASTADEGPWESPEIPELKGVPVEEIDCGASSPETCLAKDDA